MTQETATVIKKVGAVIGQIDEIAFAIAAKVEEQNAAPLEIARNVQQAAAGTRQVTSNIKGVRDAAVESGQSTDQVLSMSSMLSNESMRLREVVDGFPARIRAS